MLMTILLYGLYHCALSIGQDQALPSPDVCALHGLRHEEGMAAGFVSLVSHLHQIFADVDAHAQFTEKKDAHSCRDDFLQLLLYWISRIRRDSRMSSSKGHVALALDKAQQICSRDILPSLEQSMYMYMLALCFSQMSGPTAIILAKVLEIYLCCDSLSRRKASVVN